jgi:membrane fusion protein, adhesin transport system
MSESEEALRPPRWKALWDRFYSVCSALIDRGLLAIVGKHSEQDGDFDANADWAIAEQTPKGARIVIWLSVASVGVLLLWSAFAVLDEVTRGEGKVIPSRQIQILQSLDGGIVSEILAREGQTVKVGDLLLKVDPTRMVSSLRENQSQYLALLAKGARLRALAEGSRFSPPDEVVKQAPEIVEQERSLYESRRAELDATIGVARQQSAQRSQELVSVRARREQASQSYTLTAKELEMTRPLALWYAPGRYLMWSCCGWNATWPATVVNATAQTPTSPVWSLRWPNQRARFRRWSSHSVTPHALNSAKSTQNSTPCPKAARRWKTGSSRQKYALL